MNFISICSGIEAASVAFGPLGWRAIAFSEIEPFPCAVLAHHYPDVPNFGDMTKFREWPEEIFANADAVVGGPPCQAFSVAGARNGLNDDRGNLTLTYAGLINHADAIRCIHGKPPVVVLYENVPGLLSDKTGAFGCFLAGLAGEDDPLEPPGSKWTNAGYVSGPKRAIAWRVLDAQYFGVAQRRRRVFVVASAREGFDPAAVLFEFEGVRRDTPPSRETGEVAPTIPARSLGGGGLGTDFDCDGGLVPEIARCDTTGEAKRQDWETCTIFAQPAYAIQAGALRTNPNSGPDGVGVQADHAYTLEARAEVQAVCVTGSVTHTLKAEGFDASEDGTGRGQPIVVHGAQDPCVSEHTAFALGRNNGGENAIAYGVRTANTSSNGWGIQEEVTHALGQAMGIAVAHPVEEPFTLAIRGRGDSHNLEYRQDGTANALLTPNGGRGGIGVGAVATFQQSSMKGKGTIGYDESGIAKPVKTQMDGQMIHATMQVRRLTPEECEALQGFPRGYTKIPWRKKPAEDCPDGPRYKALGNSWAVPNVRWIGRRIQEALSC